MKVQLNNSNYSTVGRSRALSCSCSVDEGTVPPIKNSEPVFYLNTCIALVHSYVCLGCVQRRYDTVDLYSGVNSNELLRLAFQAHVQIAAFLSTCTCNQVGA